MASPTALSLISFAMDYGTFRWFILVPILLVVTLVVVLTVAIFFAALFEIRRIRPWTPVGTAMPARYSLAVPEAINQGFYNLGVFYDRDGRFRSDVSLLVSPDHQVLLMAVHGRLPRVRLMSKLPHGAWLITSDGGGEPDISGLAQHDYLP